MSSIIGCDAPGRARDDSDDLGNVCREPAIPDGILRDEPKEERPTKESVQGRADATDAQKKRPARAAKGGSRAGC